MQKKCSVEQKPSHLTSCQRARQSLKSLQGEPSTDHLTGLETSASIESDLFNSIMVLDLIYAVVILNIIHLL